MSQALINALQLIFSGDRILYQIIGVTLEMSLCSSLAALLLGVPIGTWLGMSTFRGRKILVIIDRAFMGLPPVVCGLFCYLMFSGVGPLRGLHLLYTVTGMVIAQVMLLLPMSVGMMESYTNGISGPIRETSFGLGIGRAKMLGLAINESRYHIISTFLFLLGRAMAEVGAVSIVGGAIMFKTNVMTTAIMNYTSMGNFTTAMALGIILLFISLLLNIIVAVIQWRADR
ncbi:MAG: ABC transporter permease subunit [Lachnospiraceae bacterium]|nr:ABC transporter permease subunit [Lachnospiraceae bacterium]